MAAGPCRLLRHTGVTGAQLDDHREPVLLASPLLTADDVAVLLAVPRSSVYEYARRLHDPLPSLRIGRHCRFDRASVERWLATQRAG
jgi:excisionase family DNA binding protein